MTEGIGWRLVDVNACWVILSFVALASSKAVMPEEALDAREKRLLGDEESLKQEGSLMKEDRTNGDIEMGMRNRSVCPHLLYQLCDTNANSADDDHYELWSCCRKDLLGSWKTCWDSHNFLKQFSASHNNRVSFPRSPLSKHMNLQRNQCILLWKSGGSDNKSASVLLLTLHGLLLARVLNNFKAPSLLHWRGSYGLCLSIVLYPFWGCLVKAPQKEMPYSPLTWQTTQIVKILASSTQQSLNDMLTVLEGIQHKRRSAQYQYHPHRHSGDLARVCRCGLWCQRNCTCRASCHYRYCAHG